MVDSAAAGVAAPVDVPGSGTGADFAEQCSYSKSLGFRARLCFSFDQIETINQVYSS